MLSGWVGEKVGYPVIRYLWRPVRGTQGCQMVYFQTQIPILGKFWRVLKWKVLVYFMTLGFFLRPFGIFYGHLVYIGLVWCILWSFSIFRVRLVYIFPFWYVVQRKIWQHWWWHPWELRRDSE
jgi:hypothetical protein